MKIEQIFVIIERLVENVGEVMENKIEVLGVEMNYYTAKEAMEKVVEYMQKESLQVVEVVTMNTLMPLLGEEQRLIFEEFDLALAYSTELLEAAGIADAKSLKEVENKVFVKMLFRYLHKNRVRAFLLSENKEHLKELGSYIDRKYPGIEIVDGASIEEHGVSDDMLINKVNGAEADCIIVELSSPEQEMFIKRNKLLLNAKMWLGMGTEHRDRRQNLSIQHKMKFFLNKRILKKLIKKEQQKEQNM